MNINRANLETILQVPGEPPTDCILSGARIALNEAIRLGCVDAFMVLNCETCEIADAYTRGNMEQAREECLDAIAVLMRMVDVIDGLQKLGWEAVCADCPFFRTVEGSGNPEPVCTNPVGECDKKKPLLAQGK